nr:MAG: hypothetical protein [Microvirus sp.]
MKSLNKFTYEKERKERIERPVGEVIFTPCMSLSVKEILARYASGQPLSIGTGQPEYDFEGNVDFDDDASEYLGVPLNSLDFTEIDEISRENSEKIVKMIKDKKKPAAPPAPAPPAPAPSPPAPPE